MRSSDRRIVEQRRHSRPLDARFRLVVQPDECLADRELISASPACGPRLSANMRAWNSVASSAASFIRPRYVAANMRIAGHVHFITAAADGGHLLLGQRHDRP